MPMLDETEYQLVVATKNASKIPMRERLNAALKEYNHITGAEETNPNAIWHHRRSMYGPPCNSCGKPLRTPKAMLCGSCMNPVDSK
jgi:hypothetical protein